MWHEAYHLFNLRDRPLAAVPAGRSRAETARALRALPAHTGRQHLLRAWLTARARCGLTPAPVPTADLPVAGPLAGQPLACMRPERPDECVLLAWPARPSRRRFYALRMGSDGRRASVTKVGVASPDRERIRNEARALEALSARAGLPFRLPHVLQANEGPTWSELELSAAPTEWHPSRRIFADYPADCVAAWAGPRRRLPAADVEALDWWRASRAARGQAGLADFARAARAAIAGGVDVVCAHGDLGPGNMLRRGPERLVFDWESYSESAPVRTDLVAYWLAVHHRLALKHPAAAAAALARQLLARGAGGTDSRFGAESGRGLALGERRPTDADPVNRASPNASPLPLSATNHECACTRAEITLALTFLIAQDSVAAERVAPAWATG